MKLFAKTTDGRNSCAVIKTTAAVLAGLLLLGYAGACGYLWAMQSRLIFRPLAEIKQTPADFGLRYEDVFIPVAGTGGEEHLHAWWIPNDAGNGVTVLYLHGAALNIGANSDHARRLHGLGFNVFLISYRGFGRSAGDFPSEASVYEDADAAWRYLTSARGIDPRRILIYGHSLGAAVAIDLAARRSEGRGLIAEAAFTSIREMAGLQSRYRFFPINWILNQEFESVAKVGRIRMPVLYLHGTADRLVPYRMSQTLYDRTVAPKRLLLIEGGGHNNSGRVGGALYLDAISAFVNRPPESGSRMPARG
ncbi:MAG: lysophospholipase [Desulfobacterales bacterium]|jgi:hypothetical protein|nr:lysophospholipase [Desulfobacterales bacterium]